MLGVCDANRDDGNNNFLILSCCGEWLHSGSVQPMIGWQDLFAEVSVAFLNGKNDSVPTILYIKFM